MRARLGLVPAAFLALVSAGAADPVAADPPATPAGHLAAVVGIVRVAGERTAARVEARRIPGDPPPLDLALVPPVRGEDPDPTLLGIVEGPPVAVVKADEKGEYRIDGLPRGRYQIRAEAANGAGAYAVLTADHGGTFTLDIAVAPGPHVAKGRVQWADAKPFRGAIVVAQPDEKRVARPWLDGAEAVETDAEGRFAASGLVAGRVEVSAIVPGRLRVTWVRRMDEWIPGLDLTIDAAIVEASGRVTGVGGEAIPNAPVVCRTTLLDATRVASVAVTNGEGRFRLLRTPGSARLSVAASGYLGDDIEDASGELAVRLLRAPVVRGSVRRKGDGTPVSGAWVHVILDRDRWPDPFVSARTDERGRYEVAAPVGRAHVVVCGGGWVATDPAESVRFLIPGRDAVQDFEGTPATRLVGRVVGEDGKGIAGASVEIDSRVDRSSAWGRVVGRVSDVGTDAEGRFAFENVPPDVRLRATARHPFYGWASGEAAPAGDVEVVLRRAPPLVGRVAMPSACRPCAVTIREHTADRERSAPRPAPSAPPLIPGGIGVRADGSFRLDAPESGSLDLRASAWVVGGVWEGHAVMDSARPENLIVLGPATLPGRGWLWRVVDPEGRRIPDGSAFVAESGPGYSGTKWLPIRDGEVAYWSERADTTASLRTEDYADVAGRPLPFAVTETKDLEPGVHEVRVRPGRVVRGRLHAPDGRPVPYAEVGALGAADADGNRYHDAWAETDAGGTFVLRHLERRAYEIDVQRVEGMSPVPRVVATEGVDFVDVVVLPLVRARIEVATEDGRPVADARVLVWSPAGRGDLATGALDVRTGPDGAVVLSPLPPMETFSVRVDPSGEDALAVERPEWKPDGTTFRLPRADRLRGVVRDAAGSGVEGATVWVRSVEGGAGGLSPERAWRRIAGGYALGAVTGPDGSFEVGRLVSGEVEAFASASGSAGGTVEGPAVRTPTAASGLVLAVPSR